MRQRNLDQALSWPILKTILTLAFPILLGNLLQSTYQFIDAYRIGKLGKEAVAAISISGPIIFLIIALGTGFAMAGNILIAQYAGAKKQNLINHTAGQTLISTIIISWVLGLLGYIHSDSILQIMQIPNEIIAHALPFLKISFLGLRATFSFSLFQSILRGVGEVKFPLYLISASLLLNAILDPILIIGKRGFPALGIEGAARATLISQSLAAIIGIFVLFKGNYGVQLNRKHLKPDFWFIKKALNIGFPSSIEMSVRSLGVVCFTSLVASFWTAAAAAYGAGGNIFQLILIPALGLSVAISTIVGQNLGANNTTRAQSITKQGAIFAFLLLQSAGVLSFIFAPELVSIFIDKEGEVIKIGAEYLRIISVSFWALGAQFALTGIFRAAGNTRLTLLLAIIMRTLQYGIGYFLAKYSSRGLTGLRLSFPITNAIVLLICRYLYHYSNRKKIWLLET